VLAVGLTGLTGEHLGAALLALVLWVVFLNGGTLALNSVYDKDEGDIGYLRAPPRVPPRLLHFSLVLLGIGQLLSFALPPGYRVAYAVCFAMSVLYSVPPFRFKAVAGIDWIINMIGFGTLTPYAAWAATGRPLDVGHSLVLLAFCPLFAGLYPLTQLYQFEEDQRRGDRTLALILGMGLSLTVALWCVLMAFLLFAAAAVALEVPGRIALLVPALGAWAWVLIPWRMRHARWTPEQHQLGMYRGLAAWAITDIVVVLVFAR
jgi:4-hydroxybenzoate polyprenyltransferase